MKAKVYLFFKIRWKEILYREKSIMAEKELNMHIMQVGDCTIIYSMGRNGRLG